MMKHRVIAAAVLGFALTVSATPAQAFGGKLFGHKGKCCAPVAAACGAPIGCCEGPSAPTTTAPAQAPAPAPAMTSQTVTRYVPKTVTENKPVTTSSYQWVDEKYTYQECVTTPVTKKMPVTTSSYQWVDEAHSWQECVTTPVTKKMPVTSTSYAWVDEAYTYNVCTPVTTMVMKPVSRTVCVPTQVAYTVSKINKVCVPVCGVDRCGCPTMSYRTERVRTCETCYKTVMQRQTVTEMVSCPVTTYVNTPTKGMHKVCKATTTTKEQDVTSYTNAMVTKTGTHKVCKLVTETKTMPVTSTTYEAKTETVQVPVMAAHYGTAGCGTCADACAPKCDDDNKGCKLFGRMKGLFGGRSKSSCGCN